METTTRATVAPANLEPTFAPMVPTCEAHGIGRTTAFELARDGTIETFTIGTRRYVLIESLRTLPGRLRARKAA